MATAEKRGSKYRARWYKGYVDGKSVYDYKSGFDRRSDALAYAIEQEKKIQRGIDTDSAKQSWGDWCAEWQASRLLEFSTSKAQQSPLEHWVKPFWEDVALNAITRQKILKWVKHLAGAAPSAWTVSKAFHIFSASLTAAVEANLIAANPAAGVKLPATPVDTERAFEEDEVEAILAALEEPYSLAALVMNEAGLRFGEMAALHRGRIDFDQMTIEIIEVWEDEGGFIKAYPKGRKKRYVPLTDRLAEAFKLHFEAHPVTGRTCGLPHKAGRCVSPLAIAAPRGGALDNHNMRSRHWVKALQAAGIEHGKMHWLRHTYASRLIRSKVSIQDVAAAMGHGSVYVTQRYAHLGDTHLGRVRDALNQPLLSPKPSPIRRLRSVDGGS